jgi:hypothetical protein
MTTVRDNIDEGLEAALLVVPAIDVVDFDPPGEPDTFPNLAVFRSHDREIEREQYLSRRVGIYTVEGTIASGGGKAANAERTALHAAVVAAIMADQSLGDVVELIDPTDCRWMRAPFASVPRLMFSQDFEIQFVTARDNPALPA